jgi:hypothetical protein
MVRESTQQMIRSSLADMKQPVRLVVFTKDRDCDACPGALELGSAIKAASPKIALEVYDQTMDRDKSELYRVTRVPTFVVQAPDGRCVSFSGSVEGISLALLLEAIAGAANPRAWFPGIAGTLNQLRQEVHTQVFLENDCTLCKPVAEAAVGLALTNRSVIAEIIVADDFPELLAKHRIRILPYTRFGPKLFLEGHVMESEFLEMLLKAQGQQGGAEKRCAVCGQESPGVICETCKARIQSEAVKHKRRDEHLGQTGTIVKPRKNP